MLGSDKGLTPPLNSQNTRLRVAVQIENIPIPEKLTYAIDISIQTAPLDLTLSYFNESFNAFPGTNFATVFDGISIASPVIGCLPILADR